MINNSVSCIFYFAGTKNTDYHFDAGDFFASANQSSKVFCFGLRFAWEKETKHLFANLKPKGWALWPTKRPTDQ